MTSDWQTAAYTAKTKIYGVVTLHRYHRFARW